MRHHHIHRRHRQTASTVLTARDPSARRVVLIRRAKKTAPQALASTPANITRRSRCRTRPSLLSTMQALSLVTGIRHSSLAYDHTRVSSGRRRAVGPAAYISRESISATAGFTIGAKNPFDHPLARRAQNASFVLFFRAPVWRSPLSRHPIVFRLQWKTSSRRISNGRCG